MLATGRGLSRLIGLGLAANGGWMLADPTGWFAANSIVWRTGFANGHFIRDLGWTYVFCGALCQWGAAPARPRLESVALAWLWLAGHAGLHLGEAAQGICTRTDFVHEAPAVWGPVALLGAAWGMMWRALQTQDAAASAAAAAASRQP